VGAGYRRARLSALAGGGEVNCRHGLIIIIIGAEQRHDVVDDDIVDVRRLGA
jgi:hypothetical protein